MQIDLRYDMVSNLRDQSREERVGTWKMEWFQTSSQKWKARLWLFDGETICTVQSLAFVDVTATALGNIDSYRSQFLHGADYWRTILDGAVGVDIYGNNGVAAGDFDGDGLDDLYICQPSGLPNRLYRNRGDGTFEDVTERAGVGVLDRTACALFADFLNRGRQDLLVVCGSGPLLFLNNGNGTFALKRDAFKFSQRRKVHLRTRQLRTTTTTAVSTCTSACTCITSDWNSTTTRFRTTTRATGRPIVCSATRAMAPSLSHRNVGSKRNNDRYSFACAWGDSNGNGLPDLFVANDFGSSQLYRNNGDGTFKDVSKEAQIESVGAGMGCCWCDFDNDGHQDIYVPSMWEAAGQRVSTQPQFHREAPDNIRELYRRHARGNVLYRNQGSGLFENVGHSASVEMGRWSWSSDFWDWDHDGYSDLYVTNGYLTSPQNDELAGFFWRQVVAKSPEDATPLIAYERGWNAINELIRADHTWHGHARNVAFANNRDGTFTEASGALQLDSREDSRAFALADLDHDGRLEVILKNRNAPQVRVLHNELKKIGTSISFRLRGTRSNRDAIGTSISVTAGKLTQTKYLQAGSGFLSQHAKEIFFGIGSHSGTVHATIHWPSGLVQTFADLPATNRIHLEEGSTEFHAEPFEAPSHFSPSAPVASDETLPQDWETWLIQPLKAPAFKLADLDGAEHALDTWHGGDVLLTFWSSTSEESVRQLNHLQAAESALKRSVLKIIAINLDDPSRLKDARKLGIRYRTTATILYATEEIAAIYNLLYRHLFDRQRDLPIPLSLLLDRDGMIVKVYQGFS